ncbi:lycopene cyclase domain-containing protein [Microbacterium sp.]|uniref:lycopene cyclase domain-containing protein n=1 Tax=Microbacterium sp. TaxID=51671 RepID=UPI002811F371|nr:lycopene cyclase domain-containing protein [Microbacterium sp.]
MSYPSLSLCFLAVAAIAGALLPLIARTRRPSMGGLAISAAALLLLTAVFDNVMIGSELFHYAPSQLLGLHVGLAPIEDFAYPMAAVLLLPSVWVAALRRRRRHPAEDRAADDRSGGIR